MLNQLPEPTEPFSTYAEAQRRTAQVVRCALGAAIHLSLGVDQHYSSSEPLVIVDSATRPSESPNLPRPSAPRSSPARQDAGGERPTGGNDPSSVAGYRLLSLLGAGGTADVFHAVAPVSGARVAVKIIRAGGIGERCQREYELASAVDASSTAAPIEYGLSAAGPYLVTAYLPGYRSGASRTGLVPDGRVWTFGTALARVLADIHERGVVHCDLKPSNLLIRGHDVRIIDFGISRYVGERHDDDGIVRCSRGWAAPEQLLNIAATPASDVFAWGCLLAFLSSGVHPFTGEDEQDWALRVVSAQPHLVGLPPGMEDVIRAALAHTPQDRPSAKELAVMCGDHARRADPRDH